MSHAVVRKLQHWVVRGLVFTSCIAGACSGARAYCRATTCSATQDCALDPETGCLSGGIPLFRPDPCVYVGFARDISAAVPKLAQEEFEQAVLAAFDRWRQVDCGAGPPGFAVRSVGTVDVDAPFACFGLETGNVDVWLMRKDDMPRGVTPHSGAEAGTTNLVFSQQSGVVYDADVTLDPLWLQVQGEALVDHLRVVAIHEAGHVLGLAHTPEEDAMMYESYTVTADRALIDDDIAGICALYPPASVECPELAAAPAAALVGDACADALAASMTLEGEGDGGAGGCSATGAAGASAGGSSWVALLLALVRSARSRAHSRSGPARARSPAGRAIRAGRAPGRPWSRPCRAAVCTWLGTAATLAPLIALAGCKQGERAQTPGSGEQKSAQLAVQAPSLPEDEAVVARIQTVADQCVLDPRLKALSCRSDRHLNELMRAIGTLEGHPRAAALRTTISLLGREEAVLTAICAEMLARVFAHGLGEGVGEADVSREMVQALIAAYQELPPYRARRILPAATHVAVLAGELPALLAALDARSDRPGRMRVVERLMVHGRLSVIQHIDAALDDPKLAGAALTSMRAMHNWTQEEQDALCPRALDFMAGPDVTLSARAAQVARVCHGAHYGALVERVHVMHGEGRLARRHLAAFHGRCDAQGGSTDDECASAVSYLSTLASDDKSAEDVRAGAASQLAGLIEQQGQRVTVKLVPIRRLQKSLARNPSTTVRASATHLRMALDRLAGHSGPAKERG